MSDSPGVIRVSGGVILEAETSRDRPPRVAIRVPLPDGSLVIADVTVAWLSSALDAVRAHLARAGA